MVALEIHVENRLDTDAEADTLLTMANAAHVKLSFGLTVDFMASTRAAEVVAELVDQGHAVTLHADLQPASYLTMVGRLDALTRQLGNLGGDPTVASGVCNPAPGPNGWLEAAQAKGVTTVSGVVRNCYQSLADGGPYDAQRDAAVAARCRPTTCHERVPEDDASRIHPWRTQHTGTWLSDDGSGTLINPCADRERVHLFRRGLVRRDVCGRHGGRRPRRRLR